MAVVFEWVVRIHKFFLTEFKRHEGTSDDFASHASCRWAVCTHKFLAVQPLESLAPRWTPTFHTFSRISSTANGEPHTFAQVYQWIDASDFCNTNSFESQWSSLIHTLNSHGPFSRHSHEILLYKLILYSAHKIHSVVRMKDSSDPSTPLLCLLLWSQECQLQWEESNLVGKKLHSGDPTVLDALVAATVTRSNSRYRTIRRLERILPKTGCSTDFHFLLLVSR